MLGSHDTCLNGSVLLDLRIWPSNLARLCIWNSLKRHVFLLSPGARKAIAVASSSNRLFVFLLSKTVDCLCKIRRSPRIWNASSLLLIAWVKCYVSSPYINLLRIIASKIISFHFLPALEPPIWFKLEPGATNFGHFVENFVFYVDIFVGFIPKVCGLIFFA